MVFSFRIEELGFVGLPQRRSRKRVMIDRSSLGGLDWYGWGCK